jgi:CheY-like chemotaxis protein
LLRRILHNLIANAFRYASPGKVLLGCRRFNQCVSIEVIDTGPGIALEKQHLVFEQFTQLNTINANSSKGLGLGLSIAKSFSQLLEQPLSLRSSLNKGCNFSIRVPTTEKQTQPSEQLAQNIINLQGVTVLCLENDPNLLAALVALLESWQCKILACDNTQKALSYYREYNDDIDIMLMDYQLSESTTGLEFMLQISKASSHGIPGVLLTAAADTDLPYRVEEAGFSFMKKPMKPAALRALISAILTQKMQQNYSLLEENDDEPISN